MSDELKEEIREAVEAALNKRINRLSVAVWSMVLGGLGALVFLGIEWGTIKTEVARHIADKNVHMGTQQKFSTFISRDEYISITSERERYLDSRLSSIDKAVSEMKASFIRLETKLEKK